jgi:uncharacterized protein
MTDTPLTYLDYARRGKTRWFRWIGAGLLAIVFWLISQVALALAIFGVAMAKGFPIDHVVGELQKPSNPVAFFALAAVSFGFFLIATWLAALWIQGKRFGDLIGRWRWSAFGAGALIWLVFIAVGSAADWLMQPRAFSVTLSSATATLAGISLVCLGIQTFSEEFVFRGWLTQGWLLATKNPIVTALLSGLMFGSVHLPNPNGLLSAASATTFGFATTLIAIRTGSLAFGYGMHLANNLWGAVVVVSSSDVFKGAPAIFSQNTTGLDWWDVGVEAVCLALVTTLVYMRTPRPNLTGRSDTSRAFE